MCGRYVVKNPVTKTNKIVKSAIQVEDSENYNAHPYQQLPVIKKYKNGNALENLQWGLVPSWAKEKDGLGVDLVIDADSLNVSLDILPGSTSISLNRNILPHSGLGH